MDFELSDTTIRILEEGLWEMLTEAGEWKLLETLHDFLKHSRTVMIMPRGGFSTNDEIHNMVITWLRAKGVLLFNPRNEIMMLENSLHDEIDKIERTNWLRRGLEKCLDKMVAESVTHRQGGKQ